MALAAAVTVVVLEAVAAAVVMDEALGYNPKPPLLIDSDLWSKQNWWLQILNFTCLVDVGKSFFGGVKKTMFMGTWTFIHLTI